jgi:tetratricopeptide (TPR) repeat protein
MESYLATVDSSGRNDALARAQNVIYDAWERTTFRSRVALARKALGISPLCADAYNLLAKEAATPAQACDLYARGLDAGEFALGPKGFEDYGGQFWGFLETRPYMRARHGLALTLLKLGKEEEAIEHFRAMLTLNPDDNQGIRYLMLGILLHRDDISSLVTSRKMGARARSSCHWVDGLVVGVGCGPLRVSGRCGLGARLGLGFGGLMDDVGDGRHLGSRQAEPIAQIAQERDAVLA